MDSKEIRRKFLDFFHSRGHHVEQSAPIVLKNDPTLMFTNAGMNQFKDIFLGHKEPRYLRVTDTQKCLRVSGKHNDLEEVGVDTYHHTMFEMLGNWSFGDYFKEDAIIWAWELLTEVYKLDKDRLYATVFEGSKEDKLEYDQQTHNIWKQIIDEDRIIAGNKKNNFWEMGEQGPCGPCTEIHMDLRSNEDRSRIDGRTLVNADHPQVVEIWNLVFMQYNRMAGGKLIDLPVHNVDTGMGFERLCMAVQGKQSNYDTDVFAPYIRKLEEISGVKYGAAQQTDIAIRVIVDHIRAVAFAIADGQLPSSNGAGYVIRRILRRAVRYGYSFLCLKEPFFYRLVAVLDSEMGGQFPETASQYKLIENVIREEETSFLRTLEQGLERLNQIVKETKEETVDGAKFFELYDTYGFPIDLTGLILREKGKKLDSEGFEREMEKQKQRAREASAVKTDDWVELMPEHGSTTFVGYDILEAKVRIIKYRKTVSKKGELYQLVLTVTPFYAESGGQTGDTGYLEDEFGNKTPIVGTVKENDLIIHLCEKLPTAVKISEEFLAVVNAKRRAATEANHSATHLLHNALRKVLGKHVEQKGSFVSEAGLRFDFSHFSKLSDEELAEVERLVNEDIASAFPLEEKRGVAMEDAKNEGAIALFGEKYNEKVRTVRFGGSIELCGGCHVKNTVAIRLFKILSEGAIAAGIRRMEAITGEAALVYYRDLDREVKLVKNIFKGQKTEIRQAVENIINENTSLKKELGDYVKQKTAQTIDETARDKRIINGVNFMAAVLVVSPNIAKTIAFELSQKVDNAFILLAGSMFEEKPSLTLSISKNLVEERGWDAAEIIRRLAKEIEGSGGGQKHFATAGGKNADGLRSAVALAEEFVSKG